MPPVPLLDTATLDCSRVLYSREQIYQALPQKFEFAQLDAIIHVDRENITAAAYRDIRPDEWWCRGHMPGNPLFPGILMLESAAQLSAFCLGLLFPQENSFMAFGAIDKVKFRDSVVPPARLIFLARGVEHRSRRFICDTQALLNGNIVFEGTITGMRFKASPP
ncbi:MAG TPA: 3-hydroxyacyl-ACP dehydratase FabZ family protein [Phycisphaerae bacterium]|nr:3-hydroxyacyl-ACP dehydratase FabZ family protein [Phycisphaerae bacterium]